MSVVPTGKALQQRLTEILNEVEDRMAKPFRATDRANLTSVLTDLIEPASELTRVKEELARCESRLEECRDAVLNGDQRGIPLEVLPDEIRGIYWTLDFALDRSDAAIATLTEELEDTKRTVEKYVRLFETASSERDALRSEVFTGYCVCDATQDADHQRGPAFGTPPPKGPNCRPETWKERAESARENTVARRKEGREFKRQADALRSELEEAIKEREETWEVNQALASDAELLDAYAERDRALETASRLRSQVEVVRVALRGRADKLWNAENGTNATLRARSQGMTEAADRLTHILSPGSEGS